MADNSSTYRPAPANQIAEDDPFAELTRIMGFDPREKVFPPRQQAAEPDFGIDLERELLGTLDEEPLAQAPVAPAPRDQAGTIDDAAYAIDAQYDQIWRYEPSGGEAPVLEPAGTPEVAREPVVEAEAPAPAPMSEQEPPAEGPAHEDAALSFNDALGLHPAEELESEAPSHLADDSAAAPVVAEATETDDLVSVDDYAADIQAAIEAEPVSAEPLLDPLHDLECDVQDDPAAFSASEARTHPVADPARPDPDAAEGDAAVKDFELQLADMMATSEPAAGAQAADAAAEADDGSWYDDLEFAEPDAQNETFAAHDWRDQPVEWREPAAVFADSTSAQEAKAFESALLADLQAEQSLFTEDDTMAEAVASSSVQPATDPEGAQVEVLPVDQAEPELEWEPEILIPAEAASVPQVALEHAALTPAAPDAVSEPLSHADQSAAAAETGHRELEASEGWLDAGSDAPNEHPQTETDAMQPFDERAFDAALADELAADPYQPDGGWNDVGWQQEAAAQEWAPAASAEARAQVASPSIQMDAPDIETVDFVEQRVAPSDDLDLPEVPYGDERNPRALDDFEAEFASAFNSLNDDQPAAAPEAPSRTAPVATAFDHPDYGPEHDFDYGNGAAALGAGLAGAAAMQGNRLSRAGLYEPQEQDDAAAYQQPAAHLAARRQPRRRAMILGGAVAAVALLGGISVYALSGGSAGEGPSILRADSDPIKVRPENPGGTTVPNQDNVVYDRVGSGQPLGAPTQERLITTAEAPVELAKPEAPLDDLAAFGFEKNEDRLEPDMAEVTPVAEEMVAVAPRKVRTMVVRPDGTMVPREEAAAPAPNELPAAAPVQTAAAQPAIDAVPAAQPAALADPIQPPIEDLRPVEPAAAPAPAQDVAAVEPAAAVPAAPAPIEAAAAPSGWSVQIASQPSEASAQASYQDLARRYASVLGGKGMNIVKADIAGKGTYYRVRIPAASRAEANTLCANYKSAGGSCFVSQ